MVGIIVDFKIRIANIARPRSSARAGEKNLLENEIVLIHRKINRQNELKACGSHLNGFCVANQSAFDNGGVGLDHDFEA